MVSVPGSKLFSHRYMATDFQDRSSSAPGAPNRHPAARRSPVTAPSSRLRKHGDYQRAYKASRKQFSPSMTYFAAPRPEAGGEVGRVGITAGRVLGNAVERNRIKRRLRECIRFNLHLLPAGVDVILHPRKSVLTMAYPELRLELGRIFKKIVGATVLDAGNTPAAGLSTAPAAPATISGKL